MADLDGDGHLDLLSSHRDLIQEGRPDRIYLLPGLGNSRLGAPRFLRCVDGTPVRAGRDAGAFAADWDSDGDLDLIFSHARQLVWLRNAGTSKAPLFQKEPEPVRSQDGRPISSWSDAPFVADWDGDGRTDLLVGTRKGGVWWHRNVGKKTAPVLADAERLVSDVKFQTKVAQDLGQVDQGHDLKICAVDWNRDGLLDLVVGDSYREVGNYRSRSQAELEADRARRQHYRKMSRTWQELMETPPPAGRAAARARQARLAKLDEQMRAEWKKIKITVSYAKARVWLVLRKSK